MFRKKKINNEREICARAISKLYGTTKSLYIAENKDKDGYVSFWSLGDMILMALIEHSESAAPKVYIYEFHSKN